VVAGTQVIAEQDGAIRRRRPAAIQGGEEYGESGEYHGWEPLIESLASGCTSKT
jgi:hypothetical protein